MVEISLVPELAFSIAGRRVVGEVEVNEGFLEEVSFGFLQEGQIRISHGDQATTLEMQKISMLCSETCKQCDDASLKMLLGNVRS